VVPLIIAYNVLWVHVISNDILYILFLWLLLLRFEAKPVETTRDYEMYDQLNFGSDRFDDSDFDDDNYCKYSFPAEDTNTGGKEFLF
jgi:hypothetical protein